MNIGGMNDAARHISETERNSSDAERDSKEVKLYAFLKAQITSKGSSCLQIGYGYPSAMQLMSSVFKFATTEADQGDGYSTSFKYKGFGPLHFRFDYMLGGRVGLGLSANYEMGNFKFTNTYLDDDDNQVTDVTNFHLRLPMTKKNSVPPFIKWIQASIMAISCLNDDLPYQKIVGLMNCMNLHLIILSIYLLKQFVQFWKVNIR